MKLIVTHLKAPWPAGVVVGDVVDLPDVPVWAVGKCKPAADDAEPTVGGSVFVVNPAEPMGIEEVGRTVEVVSAALAEEKPAKGKSK